MRYQGDPYDLTVKYPGHCAGCGGSLPRGARAFYYPKTKTLYGLCGHPCSCGDAARRDFESAAFDEAVYNY